MGGEGTLGVHASVHQGVALYREGDYFGSAVNLAARLLGIAGHGQLVASAAVAEATAGYFDWEPPKGRRLRGFREPIPVCRLRTS